MGLQLPDCRPGGPRRQTRLTSGFAPCAFNRPRRYRCLCCPRAAWFRLADADEGPATVGQWPDEATRNPAPVQAGRVPGGSLLYPRPPPEVGRPAPRSGAAPAETGIVLGARYAVAVVRSPVAPTWAGSDRPS